MNEPNSSDQSASAENGDKPKLRAESSVIQVAKAAAILLGSILLVACCLLMSISAGLNLDRAQGSELLSDRIIFASPLLLVVAVVIIAARFIKRRNR